jgi:Carboxypeptidase regulatory-like domain/Secretion system C-terminal sorting domain
MKTNILLCLLLMSLILFFSPLGENTAQTIKKDPVSGKYQVQINPDLHKQGKNLTTSKFNRKKFDQQLNKLKKISKLHSMFEQMHESQLKADSDRALKQKQKLQIPQLERVKLLGKPTPFYKAPFVSKPGNSFSPSHPLVSNVLINGKVHDTVYVGDPFSLTFSFAPGSITAVVNIYFDSDNNGIVSPDDLLLTDGLVMDNSDYDDDHALGTYKLNLLKGNGYSNIVSSLIFEVNDYNSVSYAILTVIQKPAASIILGAINIPLKDILVYVGYYNFGTYVLTDSAGKFSATIDRQLSSQVNLRVLDLFGISNGYIPPSNMQINITKDTTNVNLLYTEAKSFIEGYAKDQLGAPIKNVNIEADGSDYYVTTNTDSVGHYKLGVDIGTWSLYPSISWTNDYLRNIYSSSSVYVNQTGTVQKDFLFIKSNTTISGTVSCNSIGIEGIPVFANSDSIRNNIITSPNGIYSMPVYKPSSGTISYDVSASVAPGYYLVTPTWQNVEPPAHNINFGFNKITGGVEGTITDSKTGKPIADASVYFNGNSYKSGNSNDEGYYQVSLLDGYYSLSVNADYYHSYSLNDIIISGSMIKINIALDRSGSFSGTVKNEDGMPLYNAVIHAFDSSGYNNYYSYPDMQGNYVVSPLISSKYTAYASMDGYITQWYNKVIAPDSASLIPVTDGFDTPGIDFVLSKGGSISGKVLDKSGNGIPNIEVEVYDTLFNYGSYGVTDESGLYTATGLNSGKYYVRTYSQVYIDQWYDGVFESDNADLLTVILNHDTPNINFTLVLGSSISGFVKDKNNQSIPYASIILHDSLFNSLVYGMTDNSGQYSINQLQSAKKYFVSATRYGYIQRWYNNVSTPDSASPIILLPQENLANINFILPTCGIITGRVLDNFGVPVPYANVNVEDSLSINFYYGNTDYQGNYSVLNLPTGKYYASVNDYIHVPQWFDHKTSRQQADLINVVEDQTTQNINFDLSKNSSDSVIIKLKLDKIPDTLRFSHGYVSDYSIEYWWGVLFDVDGDINTGNNGCEIEIALIHAKYPGDPEFVSDIINGTIHVLLEWDGSTGYTIHSDVDVRIDPTDNKTLLMVVPKSWTELNQITSQSKYYAHSSYYSSSGVIYFDNTSVGKDMVTITDPVGDVPYNFIDIVSAGWNLKTIAGIPASNNLPVDFKLEQNFPNPFNPSTTIRYALPFESSVKIIVYNLLGQVVRQVVSEVQKAGYHEVNFNADNLASGIYFYSVVANSTTNRQDFTGVKKMLLLK